MRAPVDKEPRELPCSVEQEQALLGAILINNLALNRVSGFLEPQHFSEPLHGRLYEIIRDMIRAGKVANNVTLWPHLPAEIRKLKIDELSTKQYLAGLVAEATTVINAPDYGRGIVEFSRRREIIQLAEDLSDSAFTGDNPELAAKARDAFDSENGWTGVLKEFSHLLQG